MEITIDTDSGRIHVDKADQAVDMVDALMTASAGLYQWAQHLQGAVVIEEPQVVIYTDPLAEVEAARMNMDTWYYEMSRATNWHVWAWWYAQYVAWAEWLDVQETALGLEHYEVREPPRWGHGD